MALNKCRDRAVAADRKSRDVGWEEIISEFSGGSKYIEYGSNSTIFCQGDPADSVIFLRRGKVKISVTSSQGKEAIVALLTGCDFFGEGCMAGQVLRISTATTITDCSLAKIDKALMARMLHERQSVSELFASNLLSRNLRFEEELVDHFFNSCEKRLARILLMLANFGKESQTEPVYPRINQEDLARMVGTTRSRISVFMNKFRTLGFVDYSERGGLTVKSGLLGVVQRDLASENQGF